MYPRGLRSEVRYLSYSHTALAGCEKVRGIRKPFKRFPVLSRIGDAWLKPGVNEIQCLIIVVDAPLRRGFTDKTSRAYRTKNLLPCSKSVPSKRITQRLN